MHITFAVGTLHQTRCEALTCSQLQHIDKFPDDILRIINSLKELNPESLNTFRGIAFNQYDRFTVFWKYEAKCTLYVRQSFKFFLDKSYQEVIGNTDLTLSPEFETSFLSDIVLGLHYLHGTARLCHGQLNLHSCIVTPQWSVKLSNYALNDLLRCAVEKQLITMEEQTLHGKYFQVE